MVRLTEELIKTRIKSDSLHNIKKLNLWGCDLDDISVLSSLPSLEILSLSVNKIMSLKPLQYLHNLRECYLRKNDIEDIEEAEYLRDLSNLRVLWLDDNPIAFNNPDYRKRIIQICPFLNTLDNRFVTKEEVAEAVPGYVRPSTPPPEPHPHQKRHSYAESVPPEPPPPTARSNYEQPMGEMGFYNPNVMSQSMSAGFHRPEPPQPPPVLPVQPQPQQPMMHPMQHQHSTPEHQLVHVLPHQNMAQSYHPNTSVVYQDTLRRNHNRRSFHGIRGEPFQATGQPLPISQALPIPGTTLVHDIGYVPQPPPPQPAMMSQSLYGSLPSYSAHATPVKYAQRERDNVTPVPDTDEQWLSFDEDERDEAADKPSTLLDSSLTRFGVRRSLTRARKNRSRSASPTRLQRQENVLTAILHLMDDLDVDGLRVLIDQAHERIKKQR